MRGGPNADSLTVSWAVTWFSRLEAILRRRNAPCCSVMIVCPVMPTWTMHSSVARPKGGFFRPGHPLGDPSMRDVFLISTRGCDFHLRAEAGRGRCLADAERGWPRGRRGCARAEEASRSRSLRTRTELTPPRSSQSNLARFQRSYCKYPSRARGDI